MGFKCALQFHASNTTTQNFKVGGLVFSCEEEFIILQSVYNGFEGWVFAKDIGNYFNVFDKIDIIETYPNALEELNELFPREYVVRWCLCKIMRT